MLDPFSFAVWYIDDGGRARNTPKGTYINVSIFIKPERELLRDSIYKVFGLKARLHKAWKNDQSNIYIPAELFDRLVEIISPGFASLRDATG